MSQAEEVSAIKTGNPKWKTDACNVISQGGKPAKASSPPLVNSLAKLNASSVKELQLEKRELCPAWKQKCGNCGQMNHFSAGCNSQKANKQPRKKSVVHNLEQQCPDFSEGDSDDYLLTVESVNAVHTKDSPKKIFANMQLRDETVKFQLDCGATVNILPVDIYQQIYRDPQTRLQPSHTNLVMFNKSELKPLRRVKVETLNPKNEQCLLIEYTVVPSGHTALLGAETVQQFGLITVNADKIMSLSDEPPTKQDFVSEFDNIFLGEGKLEGKLHLELDRTGQWHSQSEKSLLR